MMVCLILTYNVIRIYHKSCWRQLSDCGLHVRAVSVFGKKSDAVYGFLAYFCAVLRFSDPPYAPLRKGINRLWLYAVILFSLITGATERKEEFEVCVFRSSRLRRSPDPMRAIKLGRRKRLLAFYNPRRIMALCSVRDGAESCKVCNGLTAMSNQE